MTLARAAVLAFLITGAALAAPPVITDVRPSYAFRYGPTIVTIEGLNFADAAAACTATCPVEVFVGNVKARVHRVTPSTIRATVLPSNDGRPVPHGTYADLRVVAAGGEVTLARGIYFADATDDLDENYVRYLLPITTEEVAGANGSRWKGELTVFNASPHLSTMFGPFDAPWIFSPPPAPMLWVNGLHTEEGLLYRHSESAGAFLYVPLPLVEATKISLRVRDISQNANSWGTRVPIVSREEMRPQVTLIDIPTDVRYRATLRIYHDVSTGGWPVRVSVFTPNGDTPVAQFDLTAIAGAPAVVEEGTDLVRQPAYAQLDLLTPAIRAAGPVIRVEVENLQVTAPPLWALVSVANNETQQVTLMTPR